MRLWEKFSKIIYKNTARIYLERYKDHSLESVLRHSCDILGPDVIEEIKAYVIKQQALSGAFADRAGKGDLYYTLFGCFVSEALGITEILPRLRQYVKEIVQSNDLSGVYVLSAAILYAKLFSADAITSDMNDKIYKSIRISNKNEGYQDFLSMLTFYYIKDYKGLNSIRKQLNTLQNSHDSPCPVTASMLVLQHIFNKPTDFIETRLSSFYMNDGSYAAVQQAPAGDLLSTAVALYALTCAKADIRLNKPDYLAYIDSLYSGGGFCATPAENSPDIEYTFYGLLALGALSTKS